MTSNLPARSLAIFIRLALALSILYSLAASPRVSAQTGGAAQQPDVRAITSVGLQYELPKGWKADNQEDDGVFLTFCDGACNVTFVFDDNYSGVVDGMKRVFKERLTDLKFDGAAKENTHNGMRHINESGTGMMKGTKMTWRIDVLKATRHVTMLTFGVDEELQKHVDEYAKFISSLKKSD